MSSLELERQYYAAQAEGRGTQAGLPVLAVKTTGIFCRPGCGAREPKTQNKHFFAAAKQALEHGYRPCKRCRPLSHPDFASPDWQLLIKTIELNPSRQWSLAVLATLIPAAAIINQQFANRFTMSLEEYAASRRAGKS